MKRKILIFFFSQILMNWLYAQGPPVFSDTPIFLGLDGRAVRTFGQWIKMEKSSVFLIPFGVPYNIRTNLLIGVVFPLVWKSNNENGMGDVSISAKFLYYQKDGLKKTFRMAFKLEEKFPTGTIMGSKAYQTYLGLISGYISTKLGIYLDLGYRAISKQLPDNFSYNLSIGIPLMEVKYPPRQVNLYWGVHGILTVAKLQQISYVSSAIQFIPDKRFLVEGGIKVPIKENPSVQERRNIIISLGGRVLIF